MPFSREHSKYFLVETYLEGNTLFSYWKHEDPVF